MIKQFLMKRAKIARGLLNTYLRPNPDFSSDFGARGPRPDENKENDSRPPEA